MHCARTIHKLLPHFCQAVAMNPAQPSHPTPGHGGAHRASRSPEPTRAEFSESGPHADLPPPVAAGMSAMSATSGASAATDTAAQAGSSDKIERLGRHAWSLVGLALAVGAALIVVRQLTWAAAPAVVVVIFAVLAAPPVAALVRRGFNRTVAVLLVYLLMIGVLGTFVWVVAPAFGRQVSNMAFDLPHVAERLAERLDNLEDQVAVASEPAAVAVGRFKVAVVERSKVFGESLAQGIVGFFGSAVGIVTAVLIGTVISFLIVKDLPRLTARINAWMDRPDNARARGALRSVSLGTTGYVRGLLLDAVIVGALKTAMLWALQIPYFVPIGILSALGNLVPAVGPIVVTIPPVLIAYSMGGWFWAVLTLAALTVVQIADYYWFSPAIVGEVHRLPALVVVIALIVGAGTAGLVGLVAAVPIAAAIRDVVHWYTLSDDRLDVELALLERPSQDRGRVRRRSASGSSQHHVSGERGSVE